jgi:hypothetical protein
MRFGILKLRFRGSLLVERSHELRLLVCSLELSRKKRKRRGRRGKRRKRKVWQERNTVNILVLLFAIRIGVMTAVQPRAATNGRTAANLDPIPNKWCNTHIFKPCGTGGWHVLQVRMCTWWNLHMLFYMVRLYAGHFM